jgi:hypothetical protein
MSSFFDKLNRLAKVVARERPKLYFFGLVHRIEAPHDRWDLLLSSEKLEPWSMDALKYVAAHLKEELTDEEIIRISQIVALPKDHPVILALSKNGDHVPGDIDGLRPADDFDQIYVLWPAKKSNRAA